MPLQRLKLPTSQQHQRQKSCCCFNADQESKRAKEEKLQ
ncbi:hypothetical protein NMG60_11004214 [Bertholletia excelsa]